MGCDSVGTMWWSLREFICIFHSSIPSFPNALTDENLHLRQITVTLNTTEMEDVQLHNHPMMINQYK
jgi:hypothetical protein